MGKLRVPTASDLGIKKVFKFLGADFSQSSDISFSRSPDVCNMIRDTPGKVRKWAGYKTIKSYDGRINGVHFYSDGTRFIHAGTKLFKDSVMVFDNLRDDFSVSVKLNGKMIVFDGNRAVVISKSTDFEYSYADEKGTVPTTMIGLSPKGGGTVLNPINMLSPKREVRFRSNDTDKIFQLPYNNLDSDEVTVKVCNASGGFDIYKEGTQFTVDRKLGRVIFLSLLPLPITAGEDNVFITCSKTNEEYKSKINGALAAIVFGGNGARDRVFCAPLGNRDYRSEFNDCLYFGDASYSILGSDGSAIMGYSIVSDKLAAHFDFQDDSTAVVFREAVDFNDKTEFKTIGSCQGQGAVSRYGFAVLGTEPLYPTKQGIFAVTTTDYTSERYSQNRSFYLDAKLKNMDLKDCCACAYEDFYMLAAGDFLFALDGLQASKSEGMPYSTRQFEGYVRSNVGARVLWEENGSLCFGTKDGKIKKFNSDKNALGSFNDDGKAVRAVWTTPVFFGVDFHNKKKMKRINALLGAFVATSCRIWAVYDGEKELVCDYGSQGRYFSFSQLTFSKLTFRTDRTPQKISEKLSGIKTENGIYFIFENDILNEPFSLEEIAIEFTEKRKG